MNARRFAFHKVPVIAGVITAVVIAATIPAYYALTKQYYVIFFNMSEAVKRLTIKTAEGQYVMPGGASGDKIGGEFIFARAEWNNNVTIVGKNKNGDAIVAELVINDLAIAENGYRSKEVLIFNQTTGGVAGTVMVERVSHVNRHHAAQRK